MNKIVSVTLDLEPPIAPGFPSGQNVVNATLDDGTTERLFSYYFDELTFTENEFVGLTVRQAQDLFTERDLEYLRS